MNSVVSNSLLAFRSRIARRMPSGFGRPRIRQYSRRLRIRTMGDQPEIVNFHLRPIQKTYLAAKRLAAIRGRDRRFLLLKYRRGGFTTLEQAESYLMASGTPNVQLMTMAQDDGTTSRIFKIAKLMHDLDPEKPEIKGPGNQYKLEFPYLRSLFYVSSANTRSYGRGDTLQRVHWSEVAWSCVGSKQSERQREILVGLNEASKGGEMVLETTPNGSELFRELYVAAKEGRNKWTPIFLPWWSDERHRLPCTVDEAESIAKTLDDSEERLLRLGVDFEQLKWRRDKILEIGYVFFQEYPDDDVTCWLISGIPYFDSNLLIRLQDSLGTMEVVDGFRRPRGAKSIPGGWEVIWEPPMPGVEYCIGADTSEGLPGGDMNGLGVLRRDTGEQVASLHGLFTPPVLADHCCRYTRLYNDALLGVERNNHGHAVLQKIMDLGVDVSHAKGGSLYFHNAERKYGTHKEQQGKAGWDTNSVTRPVMLQGIRDWLSADGVEDRVRDPLFVAECLTFRKQSDGSFDHDSGCHDDSIFKWGIAEQMRKVEQVEAVIHLA